MKKLKLNLSNRKPAEILTREQLKEIMGGDGSGGGACQSNTDCTDGRICCNTTDGSGVKVCVFAAGGGGCPSSGVSGCSTKCFTGGIYVGCYWDTFQHKCRCTEESTPCVS